MELLTNLKLTPYFPLFCQRLTIFTNFILQQDRDAQKLQWIKKFVDELKNDQWVLPALKQIKEICTLFPEVKLGKTLG